MARTPVEQIKERLSIIDVVGSYVELTKAGRHYKGKSPFTNEKTPSFFVSPDRGVYFCFSSQKGGDMFTFIQEMEGVDFKGALKILADKAHVELVPEDPAKRDQRETLYALLEDATGYFKEQIGAHTHAREYVLKRGVTEFSMEAWQIGYAPDEWRGVKAYLTAKGYRESDIMAAGLIKQPDPGKEAYDVFRDRIMFPIKDVSGRVVAFSGRTLKTEDGVPKYVNSPETELYKKSEILYGYDRARQGIRHYDFSLIVEGQFDLVLAHQAGYANTVAVSGTAFTDHHLMLLTRLSNRLVLSLDADRAGINAMKRSAVPMLRNGMDVKVAEMPEGEDPADVVRRDPGELKKLIGQATHVVEFLLRFYKKSAKDERAYKLLIREELIPILIAIPNRIDREHFEGVVGEATGTTKDAIHYEVERQAEKGNELARPEGVPGEVVTKEQIDRKDSVALHLVAYADILRDTQPDVYALMRVHVDALIPEGERETLKARLGLTTVEKAYFNIEARLEKKMKKELIEELGDALTLLSHLKARDELARMKQEMLEAEDSGDAERLQAALVGTKNAQLALSQKIDLV